MKFELEPRKLTPCRLTGFIVEKSWQVSMHVGSKVGRVAFSAIEKALSPPPPDYNMMTPSDVETFPSSGDVIGVDFQRKQRKSHG